MRVAVLFVCLLGCGINETGELDVLDAGGGADVVIDKAVADVTQEPVVCSDAGVASCTDAVPFRSPVLYAADRNTPCPAGYDTRDVVLSVPNALTCTCTCGDAGTPSCDTTNVSYHYGAGNCTVGSGSYTLNATCATTAQQTLVGESVEIDVPAVTGGCNGGTPVPPASTTTSTRVCTPLCTSDESVCAPQTGFRACVEVAGNVASCPSNYASGPFYVGANPVTTCDACSCTAQGDCSGSTAHLYSDTGCNNGDQGFPMDGQCHALNGGHVGSFFSGKITPDVKSTSCKVTEGSSHTTYGGNDVTVCCQ